MEGNVHGFNDGPQQRNNNQQDEDEKDRDPLQGLECSICVEKPIQPVMTKCGHIFCHGCITNWLQRTVGSSLCPTCKSGISKDNLQSVLGEKIQQDERYDNQNLGNNMSLFAQIFASIGAVFSSGFGILPLLKFLNLGRFFGDRENENEGDIHVEGRKERNFKIALAFVLLFLILLKIFGV